MEIGEGKPVSSEMEKLWELSEKAVEWISEFSEGCAETMEDVYFDVGGEA